MTPPKQVSSAELNYTPADLPLQSVVPANDGPVCSGLTQKCYASAKDFVSDLVSSQKERRLQQAAALFQKNPPVAIQPKKDQDLISSMWGGVSNLWNDGDHALAILAGAGATLGTVIATPLTLTGCSGNSDVDNTVPEIPDGSNPPPDNDPACDGAISQLQGANSDPSLKSLVDGITLPTLDVTYDGIPFAQDSKGNTISEIKCSNPIAWQKVGDRLFVVTQNPTDSGGFAPATVLVYKVNGSSVEPIKTNDIANKGNSNAIVFHGLFKPTKMGSMSDGSVGILFDIPIVNKLATFSPTSLDVLEADWCSTHGVAGDGGASGSGGSGGSIDGSGGTGGTGGDSGVGGAGDGGAGEAGKADGGAGEAGAPADAGSKG